MLQSLMANGDLLLAAMPAFLGNIWNITQIILGFSLIVFVHELGHFAAAKWAGVRVERFAIGFGKELLGFTKGETRYSFNVLPLGGYVKMLGQEDFVVDKTGELKVKQDPRSFTNKSVGKRMVIVCAGVVMNLIFAAIAFTIVAMVGRMKAPAVVGLVDENLPAGRAGILPSDRILEINGTAVEDFDHLMRIVSLSDEGVELEFKIERNGKIVEPYPRVIPEYQSDSERRQIGIGRGWNYRVGFVPKRGELPIPDDQLQLNDKITHVIVQGQRIPLEQDSWMPFIRQLYTSMGRPMELVVQRPVDPESLTEAQVLADDPDIKATEHVVKYTPEWVPIPYNPATPEYASLLGFVPRLSPLHLFENDAFTTAGMQYRDVIVGIGEIEYPSWPELQKAYEENAGKTIPLRVRRISTANHDLSAKAVDFLIEHRETLIAAAIANLDTAKSQAAKLIGESSLEAGDKTKALAVLTKQESVSAWRSWLDVVDVHELSLKVPSGSLFSSDAPKIGAYLRPADEGMVFIADTIPAFGDRATPARESGIPRFAVVLNVNDKPIGAWRDFFRVLAENAGKTVSVKYRRFDIIGTAQLNVPMCVQSALGLNRGDGVTKINGESEIEIVTGEDEDGNEIKQRAILPDWRAVAAMLKQNEGKTVEIEYARLSGERGKASYAVTAANIDPWLDRVQYGLPQLYPLSERHPITNPIDALVAGTQHAYDATISTVQTIKQLVMGNVGTKNMSGPLGIINIGAKVADHSTLDLIWLLGFLSANLAVINFLPLPIVDGGLFLFLILEKIRGEPVSIKVQVATQIVGIALIATVFILVTAQDVYKML